MPAGRLSMMQLSDAAMHDRAHPMGFGGQRRRAVDGVDVIIRLEAFIHQDGKRDFRVRVNLAHCLLGGIGQQRHVNRIGGHQLGDEGLVAQGNAAVNFFDFHLENGFADGFPERVTPFGVGGPCISSNRRSEKRWGCEAINSRRARDSMSAAAESRNAGSR